MATFFYKMYIFHFNLKKYMGRNWMFQSTIFDGKPELLRISVS